MTELEDTLTRALATEAGRHRPPLFNVDRIAEAAVTRRRFWRRPLFALAAAAIGAGGVGGATVLAAGGHHRSGGQVSVTFQSKTGSVGPQATDASVESWVRQRAELEALTDVTATVRHSPWRLVVTGHAADLDRLKTLGEPGVVQFRPVVDRLGAVPTGGPPQACTVSTVRTGAPWRSCDREGKPAAWIADPVGVSYHVTDARTRSVPAGHNWMVAIQFDTAGANALAAFSTRFSQQMVALMVDGALEYSFIPEGQPSAGAFQFEAGTTQRQAEVVAAILATQGPSELEGATVTVSSH